MRIAGIVILYHPTEDVFDNIQSYLPYLDLLIVTDNTEPNANDFLLRFTNHSNVLIRNNPENLGIAKPLNDAAGIAIEKGYDWLLTMDQDSSFHGEDFKLYIQCANDLNKDGVAMMGVNHVKGESKLQHCRSTECSLLITSGSLLNLKHIQTVGFFDEQLFIDFVDTDYCWRSRLKGLKLISFPDIVLQHQLGQSVTGFDFKKGKQAARKKYSTLRIYYMVRNFIYLNKKYGNRFSAEFRSQRSAILNTIKNNLLYERQAFKLIKFLRLAWADAGGNRMGKY